MRTIIVKRRVGSKVVSYRAARKGVVGRAPRHGGMRGWHKGSSEQERHIALLKVAKIEGGSIAKAKLVQLANITADDETHRVAMRDFEWLRRLYPPRSVR